MANLFDNKFRQGCESWHRQAQLTWGRRFLGRRLRARMAGGTEATGSSDYTAGDDFRYVDWYRCARHDELVSRQFQGTEDHHVYFLLDCSASMLSGSSDDDRSEGISEKFNLARQLTAALAQLAIANHDRVTIVVFADHIISQVELHGRKSLPRLFSFLESLQTTAAANDFTATFHDFAQRYRRRGLTVVVSDLLDGGGFASAFDLLRLRGYEPFVVQTFAETDRLPRIGGRVELVDRETSTSRRIAITPRDQENYRKVFEQFSHRVRAYCHRYGLGITQVDPRQSLGDCLQRIFRGSAHRMTTRAGVR